MNKNNIEKLILDLLKYKCIEFGSFKLKSGVISPYYIDLRKLVSYPMLMKSVANQYWSLIKKLKFDYLVGVPYTALPITAVISVLYNQPFVYVPKEQKKYGIVKLVQGEFKKGKKALVIDDIITTGASKLMVIKPLEKSGLKVKDIVLLIDRENGGKEIMKKAGYNLHTVYKISDILNLLMRNNKITCKLYNKCFEFMEMTKKKNISKL